MTKRTITLSEDEYLEHCDSDDGVCLACGDWTAGGVEPDARNYPCDRCRARQVFGAEEALVMGNLVIGDE